jgi:hypothetical protein
VYFDITLGQRAKSACACSGIVNQKEELVTAISFQIELEGRKMGFRLPCDWRPVLEILKRDAKVERRYCDQPHAVRVSWRIVKDWVEAQMALVEKKMATTQEVFLPYAVMKNGLTLAQNIANNPDMVLGDGK